MAMSGNHEIVTEITADRLKSIVEKHGTFTDVQVDGNKVICKIAEMKGILFISSDQHSIQYHWAAAGTKATLQKVNKWNREKRFSRAYMDDEDDPHLELDLDLEGGVTVGRIDNFLRTVTVSLVAFMTEVCL